MLAALSAEFPREAISWRAQSVTKDGTKAMAMAYIDARDVMDRLDTVCGPINWQDRYEFHGTRTICYLSIRIGEEWITKADGAGDSDVEAEKGAISDALKRAAVKWGVGRYLYALETPWVPCEAYETEYQGKKKWNWKRWTADPWSFVKGAARASSAQQKQGLADIDVDLLDCASIVDVDKCAKIWAAIMDRDGWSPDFRDIAKPKFAKRREAITNPEKKVA
jgi:hypothetical protein